MTNFRLSLATKTAAVGLVFLISALSGCQRAADTPVAPTPSVTPSAASPAVIEKPANPPPPAATSTSPLSSPVESRSASPTGEAVHRFEIRDQEGKPIITDRQIVAYDWKTHRITLGPGTKVEPPPKEGQSLISGIPFAVAADGVVCYAGVFTSSLSSASQSVVVIDVHPLEKEDGTVRIELGYPTEQFFRGVDPRDDRRIRTSLVALGKLKE